MAASEFVDTNVLLYAISTRVGESSKRAVARNLLRERDFVVSVQVLAEFYAQATRPGGTAAMTHAAAATFIDELIANAGVSVLANDLKVLRLALSYKERFELSFWDCSILAAARGFGCRIVLSEDLSHQQAYDGLRVVNPFAAD